MTFLTIFALGTKYGQCREVRDMKVVQSKQQGTDEAYSITV